MMQALNPAGYYLGVLHSSLVETALHMPMDIKFASAEMPDFIELKEESKELPAETETEQLSEEALSYVEEAATKIALSEIEISSTDEESESMTGEEAQPLTEEVTETTDSSDYESAAEQEPPKVAEVTKTVDDSEIGKIDLSVSGQSIEEMEDLEIDEDSEADDDLQVDVIEDEEFSPEDIVFKELMDDTPDEPSAPPKAPA